MENKVSFAKLLSYWFFAAVFLFLINANWIRAPLLQKLIPASLGIILLVYPAMPDSMYEQYGSRKGRLIIRAIAAFEIIATLLFFKF